VIPLAAKEVPVYEASHTFKMSKFQELSPLAPYNPKKTKDFAALYRERIYFLSSEAERAAFMKEPSRYTGNGIEAFPLDIQYKPRMSVLGLPKSGKSDLCKSIS
jgi:YHS domain-containing protein